MLDAIRLRSLAPRLTLCALALAAGGAGEASATAYNITILADDTTVNGNCTLREAIRAAATDTAVDACPAGSAVDEIRIAPEGQLPFYQGEEVLSGSGIDITIRGGSPHREEHVISVGESGRFASLTDGARLQLEELTVKLGDAESGDGGLLHVSGGSTLALDDVVLAEAGGARGGCVSFDGSAGGGVIVERSLLTQCYAKESGGAVHAELAEADFLVRDSVLEDNHVTNISGDPIGGGIYLSAVDAKILLEKVRLTGNSLTGASGASPIGSGLRAHIGGQSEAVLSRLEISGNVMSPAGGGAIRLVSTNDAIVLADRLEVRGNTGGANEARVEAWHSSSLTLANLLVVGGDGNGLTATGLGTATLRVAHVTAADHLSLGLWIRNDSGGATVSLHKLRRLE